jgi:membrane associated rhomboid family serine protease
MTVLLAVIVLNVVVSLAGFRVMRDRGAQGAESYLFVPNQVARGENGLGMLLAHFAHGGFAHLAFNMIALYSFSGTVINVLGPAKFLLIYAVAGLGADLVVFALHKDDPTYRCLGASGSVFAIMMAAIVLDPTTSIVAFLVPVPIPGPLFMLGYTVIALFLIAQKRRGGVSHEGHLGGAIVGLALTGVLAPSGLQPLIRWFGQWW